MKNFLAIFIGDASSPKAQAWSAMDADKRKALEVSGFNQWVEWMTLHQLSLVGTGGPLGKTKRVSPDGVADTRNNMSAYVVVQAESHDAAARLFEKHPHFMAFPGDSVEIMECLPIPGPPQP